MYAKAYVEITNLCNIACSFCHGHRRTPRQMTQEEFRRVLQQLEGKTEYLYYHLMGEPLTHPQLPLFLQMAARKGLRSILTTNGTLLHKRGEEILAAGLHKVSVSLHSFEGSDDRQFMDYLEQVAEFADKANEAGVLVSLRLWNRGCDGGKNAVALDLLRQRLKGQWAENAKGYRIREKLYLEFGDRFAWPDMAAQDRGERVYCYGLKDQFGILCDGTVVPCCLDSEGTIALGNVFTEELSDILSSPRATAMAKGFACRKATEELCRRCGYARRFG